MTSNATKRNTTPPPSRTESRLLAALSKHADANGQCAFTFEQLEEFSFLSPRTIRKALTSLEAMNYITDTGERIGKAGTTKVWQLVGE